MSTTACAVCARFELNIRHHQGTLRALAHRANGRNQARAIAARAEVPEAKRQIQVAKACLEEHLAECAAVDRKALV